MDPIGSINANDSSIFALNAVTSSNFGAAATSANAAVATNNTLGNTVASTTVVNTGQDGIVLNTTPGTASDTAEPSVQTFFSQYARNLLDQEIANGPLNGLLRNDPLSPGYPYLDSSALYGATGIVNLASSIYLNQLDNQASNDTGTDTTGLTGFGSNALEASQNAIQNFLNAYTTVSLLGSLPDSGLPQLPTTSLLPLGSGNTTGTNGFDFGTGASSGNAGVANANGDNAIAVVQQNINIFA